MLLLVVLLVSPLQLCGMYGVTVSFFFASEPRCFPRRPQTYQLKYTRYEQAPFWARRSLPQADGCTGRNKCEAGVSRRPTENLSENFLTAFHPPASSIPPPEHTRHKTKGKSYEYYVVCTAWILGLLLYRGLGLTQNDIHDDCVYAVS